MLLTLEKVIELGRINYDTSIFDFPRYWILWTLIILVSIIFVHAFAQRIRKDDENYSNGMGASFSIGVILALVLLCSNGLSDWSIEQDKIKEWKSNVAIPYIASLKEEKAEVVFIKIDTALSHSVQGNLWITYSKEIKLTPLTVSFKGNGIETYTDWYEANMNLTSEEKPYILYKRLESDLGHDIKAGLYDKKVYLPDSYKFSEIK